MKYKIGNYEFNSKQEILDYANKVIINFGSLTEDDNVFIFALIKYHQNAFFQRVNGLRYGTHKGSKKSLIGVIKKHLLIK